MKHIKLIYKNSNFLNYLLSFIFVLLIGSVLIIIQGSNPIEAFSSIIIGSIGSKGAIASSIRWSTPVIIASMAAVVAHKSGINNLGLDGQIYLGAFAAGLMGAFISLPDVFHKISAILIGGLAGALFAVIPAILRTFLKIDEMVTTLMFNYIALLLTEFFTLKLMGFGANTNPDLIATPEILESAKLVRILPPYQSSTGIFIALLIVIVLVFLYKKTKIGYEWTIIGKNIKFAKYGGIKTKINFLIIFLTSAFIAGICGSVEILGPHLRFRSYFSNNLGWDGIMVALIAKNNPVSTIIVAIIWGMIKAGSLSMERTTSVNRILVYLIQALFVLFITVDFKTVIMNIKTGLLKRFKNIDEKKTENLGVKQ